jgi:methylenetetrahydrofolate dehydrogenase (NAD+)
MREVSRDDIEDAILAANTDNSIDGIIVYYPIFNNRQDQYLQQIVDFTKDVEGLSHRYIFNMYQNIRFLDGEAKRQKSILPCTPLANIKILEYLNIYNTILPYGNRLFGHTICVVNRSEVVGRPLAALLANDGACVYSVDVTGVQKFTRGEGLQKKRHEILELEGKTIKDVVPLCDVVITGVPGEGYKFDTSLLREGAVCVNFSSEKVCLCSLYESIEMLANQFPELPLRGPRQGLSLRSLHRKGHHCCPAAQPAGKYYRLSNH